MTILSQELFIIVDKLIQKQSDIERRSERKLFKMKHHYFKILNFLLLRYFQFSFRAGGGGCFVSIGRSFLIPAATCATLLHYQIGSTVGLSSLPVPTTSAESRRIPLKKYLMQNENIYLQLEKIYAISNGRQKRLKIYSKIF